MYNNKTTILIAY